MKNLFTIEDVRRFWDSVAHKYESTNAGFGYIHTERFETAMELGDLRPGMYVLNIWSRTGNLLPYLEKIPGLIVQNREVSPKMLAIAQRHYPHAQCGLTDLENLSEFPDASFDRIISLETLEHTPNPTVFLSELHRVLRPGGRLIMSLPPSGMELPLRIYELFFENHGEGPHRFLSARQVRALLAESNFRLIAHRPTIMVPFLPDSILRGATRLLRAIFGKTPVAHFAVRHFYVCER